MPARSDPDPARPIRLIHFSDIHATLPVRWRPRDWLSKRLTGWLNWQLGRAPHFQDADAILHAFRAELQRRPPDGLIFSGDATTLGFDEEFHRAVERLGVGQPLAYPAFAVPGNHDYYTRATAAAGLFEKHFAPWQHGLRVEDAAYPFARRVGHVWLIGVNSCTANRSPMDARGFVGRAQLDRLRRLLDQLDEGPRILVTHYPVALATGEPEHRWHGLRDLEDVLKIARAGGIALWLHGHRHHPYDLLDLGGVPFPVLCAGSLTQRGCASFGEYEIQGRELRGVRRVHVSSSGEFEEGKRFEIALPNL